MPDDVANRAMEIFNEGFVKRANDAAWHDLLAGADRPVFTPESLELGLGLPPGSLQAPPAPARPDWDSYFLGLAFVASRRSHDVHTKHGSCLVDPRNNRILSLGYNGFPRGMDDDSLPLTRPEKYAWMDHSEPNAIANLTKDPWDIPGGPVLFCTGQPCFDCGKHLIRHNIKRWVLADRRGYTAEASEAVFNLQRLVRESGVVISRVRPALDWLIDAAFVEEIRSHGFLGDQSTPRP